MLDLESFPLWDQAQCFTSIHWQALYDVQGQKQQMLTAGCSKWRESHLIWLAQKVITTHIAFSLTQPHWHMTALLQPTGSSARLTSKGQWDVGIKNLKKVEKRVPEGADFSLRSARCQRAFCWPKSYSPRRADRQALICVKADWRILSTRSVPLLKSHAATHHLCNASHIVESTALLLVSDRVWCEVFSPQHVRERKKSLTPCFFGCSIPLSPFVASNWVSLIYSSMMLPWLSLCWPCKKNIREAV